MIPVFRPFGGQEEIEAVTRVLLSSYWGSGPECIAFEDEFASYLNVKHCLATNSCTSSLILAGRLLDLPKDSEIIIPAITWVSTAFVAAHNHCTPIFADVLYDDLTIDPEDIRRKITNKTKAIVIMHHGGYACQYDKIKAIADEDGLIIIEDCAHALGGYYNDKPLGSLGDIACFSFQAVKNMSTGDGGMLVLKDEKLFSRAKSLRWLGLDIDTSQRHTTSGWQHDMHELGYKFQMNDIAAAIGRAQLEKLSNMNTHRKLLASRYDEAFKDLPLKLKTLAPYQTPSNHFYMIKTDKREGLRRYLLSREIHSSVHYKPLYQYSYYSKYRSDCPVADRLWEEILTIPLYACMSISEQDYIIDAVRSFFGA